MRKYHRNKSAASNALTDLIRGVIRMGALSNEIGTRLIQDMKLTSSRWVTLGELVAAEELYTVSELARRMGKTRQSTQRMMNGLRRDGLVTMVDNPADQRARKIKLTARGRKTYRQALEREWRWTNRIANHFSRGQLEMAAGLIQQVAETMEKNAPE